MENSKFGSLPKGFGRAFDLSALARPAQQATTSSASSNGTITVTETNLVPEFLEHSQRIPVILFVWSERAKGSQEMLALLAQLASEDGGAWRLGSVSFDSEPQIAQALRVTAIPAAVAILKGQLLPIPQLPPDRASLRTLIDKILDVAKEQGMTVTRAPGSSSEPAAQVDPEEDEAYAAIERGDFESAAIAYRKLLARKPSDPLATQALAQCELMIRTSHYDAKQVLASAEKSPDDLELQKQASDIEVAMGQFSEGFTRLIAFIRKSGADERKEAKEHLLTLFTVVPHEDPALLKARRELASALF